MTVKLSIVVPVYRSEKILTTLVEEVKKALAVLRLSGQTELLLVNDASPDGSWQVVRDLAMANDFVRGISLRKNFGQHSATMAGLNYARGEVVVVMDDDLQHSPGEIGNMLRVIDRGADVCFTRFKTRHHALWKVLGSHFNDWAARVLLQKPHGLYLSSFKAMRREVVREVVKYDGPYAYLDGLILDVTRSIEVLEVDHLPRREGVGNYDLTKSISLWLRMATSFSIVPLRLATALGFSLTLFSCIMIVVVIAQKLLHPELPAGWASLIATMLFVGGVQTFCVGMVGEYIGRAYLKINGKPQFVVRETTWLDEKSE